MHEAHPCKWPLPAPKGHAPKGEEVVAAVPGERGQLLKPVTKS